MGKIYKNKIRLENPRAVQRLLARTINALHDNDIEEGKARTIGYLANIMLRAFETVELEDRLKALEEGRGVIVDEDKVKEIRSKYAR